MLKPTFPFDTNLVGYGLLFDCCFPFFSVFDFLLSYIIVFALSRSSLCLLCWYVRFTSSSSFFYVRFCFHLSNFDVLISHRREDCFCDIKQRTNDNLFLFFTFRNIFFRCILLFCFALSCVLLLPVSLLHHLVAFFPLQMSAVIVFVMCSQHFLLSICVCLDPRMENNIDICMANYGTGVWMYQELQKQRKKERNCGKLKFQLR